MDGRVDDSSKMFFSMHLDMTSSFPIPKFVSHPHLCPCLISLLKADMFFRLIKTSQNFIDDFPLRPFSGGCHCPKTPCFCSVVGGQSGMKTAVQAQL